MRAANARQLDATPADVKSASRPSNFAARQPHWPARLVPDAAHARALRNTLQLLLTQAALLQQHTRAS